MLIIDDFEVIFSKIIVYSTNIIQQSRNKAGTQST